MHERAASALALLLLSPLAAADPPPAAEPFPLALEAPAHPPSLPVAGSAMVRLAVRSEGLAGQGANPPAAREVRLRANLSTGEPARVEPEVVALPPGGTADAWLRFLPLQPGPLAAHVEAAWVLLPGEAHLDLAFEVVRDPLAIEGFAAGGPDADLRVPLRAALRSARLEGEPVAWSVEAEHWARGAGEPFRWRAAQGHATADPAGSVWEASVPARYGPGRYAFTLRAEGPRLAPAAAALEAEVPEVRGHEDAVPFALEVEDAPTTLRLASDSVNADGKTKSPGSALITRVVVGDANGLRDLRRVTFTYAREDRGGLVPVEAHVREGFAAGATEAALEDRFDRAPLKDGSYVCTVLAEGSGNATVQRTFAILDAKPVAALELPGAPFRPLRDSILEGTLRVADANYGTGPLDPTDVAALGALRLTLYKGSAAVAEPRWALQAAEHQGAATLDLDLAGEGARTTRWGYAVRDGRGELALPVRVAVPEGAAAGSYRVSVAWNGTTLVTAPFGLEAVPRLTVLRASGDAVPGALLNLTIEADADGVEALVVGTSWGGAARALAADLPAANGTLRWLLPLELPARLDDEAPAWVRALADAAEGRAVRDPWGRAVNERREDLAVANAAPTLEGALRLDGVEVGPEAWVHPGSASRLEARVRADDANALDPDLADELGPVDAAVLDWEGRAVPWPREEELGPTGGRVTLEVPANASRGRYDLLLRARDDDGAVAEQRLAIHVGLRFRVGLLAPPGGVRFERQPAGDHAAAVEVRNLGNAPASALAVLLEGLPNGTQGAARLDLPDGTALEAPLRDGFARVPGPFLLPPGASASLRVAVRLPAGAAPGAYAGRLVVAGESA